MGVCIMACSKDNRSPSDKEKIYIQPEALSTVQQELEKEDHFVAKEETIRSATNNDEEKENYCKSTRQQSTCDLNSSSVRKSRFYKKQLNSPSLPQSIEGIKIINIGIKSSKVNKEKLLKVNYQEKNKIYQLSSLKAKSHNEKSSDNSILKNRKVSRSRKTTCPSISKDKMKGEIIFPNQKDHVIEKSRKDDKRKKKVTLNQQQQWSQCSIGPSFKDALSEGEIKVTQSTFRDPTCLNNHKLPDPESDPTDNISQNLIKSTLSFSTPQYLKAEVYFDDESRYTGEWMKGQKHGEGVLNYADGCYKGQWKFNMMQGKGEIIFENGQSYEGQWQKNKAHGSGTFRYKNGSYYKGQWKNNRQDGFGMHQWSSTQYYSGSWSDGYKHGYGQLIFSDGSFYKGQFNGNQLHGQGEYFYKERNQIYKGTWEHNQKSGLGFLEMEDGSKYQGEFKHDKMHGDGILTDADGNIFEGKWQHGKKQGFFIQTSTDGKKTQGLWYYGKLVSQSQDVDKKKKKKKSKQDRSSTLSV